MSFSTRFVDRSPEPWAVDEPPATDVASVEPVASAPEVALVVDGSLFSLLVIVGWISSGLIAANAAARRGHDRGPLLALGIVLGPCMAFYIRSNLIHLERRTDSEVLAQPVDLGGSSDVVIVVLDDPARVADARSFVSAVGTQLRYLTLARAATFETLRADDGIARERRAREAEALEAAARSLGVAGVGLVLYPGRPSTASQHFIADRASGLVIAVGKRPSAVAKVLQVSGWSVAAVASPPAEHRDP